MKKPLISVIMSVYNEQPLWLKQAIESILTQTYKRIEFIIIIDNPTNTELINIAKAYEERDIRIKIYINEKNMGLVYSLNRALGYVKGDYVARMDADDISLPERFEKQLYFLVNNNLDLIGANVSLFKDEFSVFHTTDKLRTHGFIKKMLVYGTINIVHPTFFGRTEIFNKLNGYANSIHTEDKEFLARVFHHGYQVANMKDVLLYCRYSDDSVTKTNAIYVHKMGQYVTKVFRKSLKTGFYDFDYEYFNKLLISQNEIERFNKSTVYKVKARQNFNAKSYVRFCINLIMAVTTQKAVFSSLKINIIQRILRTIEKKRCKLI